MFSGKVLLITGGTGSFGSTVLKRFISEDFAEIRIFSRDEKKQEDQRLHYRDPRLRYYIGDVRDYAIDLRTRPTASITYSMPQR